MTTDIRAIGPYRIIAGLGMGGMARVYLAMSSKPGFDKLFVLKVLREELVADEEFLAMFMNEARVAARLNHPNVVHTYEIGHDGDQHFIAMEYLEGQSLSSILSRVGRVHMPLAIHLRVLCDVLAGLHYAHELKDYDGTPLTIVHRDVSPQNVFVTYPGQTKLLDFGIAKVAGSAALTREGAMKGKLGYMAPEQAMSQPVDPRADIFSVGVMLWEALTCSRLFQTSEGEAAVLRRRISGDEVPVKDLNPDAPDELVAICEKAMAHDRTKRYERASDFRDALEGYLRKSSHPDAFDVADFLKQNFAEDRVKILRLVEQEAKTAPTSAPLIMLTSPTPRDTPRSNGRPSDGALLVDTLTRPAPATGSSGRKRTRAVVLAVSLVGLGAIAGAALFMARKPVKAPIVNATPVTAPTQAPVSITSAAPPPIAPPLADKTVTVSFDVAPANARVLLDGKPLDPPFDAKRASDSSPHRLEVSAPGYAPQSRTVNFDKDHRESISLARAGGGWAARPRTQPTTQTGPQDVDLSKEPKNRPKRAIDDQDPY